MPDDLASASPRIDLDAAQAREQLVREQSQLCEGLAAGELEDARGLFESWITEQRRGLARAAKLHPIDRAKAREALDVLDNLIAPVNEAAVGDSTLDRLRAGLAGDESPAPGFWLEFVHLLRAASGRSGYAQGVWSPRLAARGAEPVDFNELSGRAAGLARSAFLDDLGAELDAMTAFPCGLDTELAAERARNRARILEQLGASEDDWQDHHWQLGHLFKGPGALERLEQLVPLSEAERASIRDCVEHRIPFGVTPHYLSLFDFDSAERERDAQVRAQVIPPASYVRRMIEHRDDRKSYFDFMGEADTSPCELVTRRYPQVAILKALDTCPQICTYCQRNFEIGGPMEAEGFPATSTLERALAWFAEHPRIHDVLITGGDPLFHGEARIRWIMDTLAAMPQVRHIRWGTRAPVTMPMRVNGELAELLAGYVEPGRRMVSLVTHVETAAEVTPDTAAAVDRLRRAGIPVYNQQVFTFQTSRRFETVANRLACKRVGIDPYYTFLPKGKQETRDYLTPVARLAQERKEEARLLPGIFRTDEPVYNVPRLGKNHVRATGDRELIAIQADGSRVYRWHPWEKGMTDTKPWVHEDESIHEYLQRLVEIGEDPGDYASIWYYY